MEIQSLFKSSASAGSMAPIWTSHDAREHPLCQFGLLILFLQTFEESNAQPRAQQPPDHVFPFRVVERSLIAASLIPRGIRRPAHVQVASSRAVSLVFVAHSACKVRIAQRRLRAGLRPYFAARQASAESPVGAPMESGATSASTSFFDVLALSGVILRHVSSFSRANLPAVAHSSGPLTELLPDAALLLWSKVLKCFAVRSTRSRCCGVNSRLRSTNGRGAPTPACCLGAASAPGLFSFGRLLKSFGMLKFERQRPYVLKAAEQSDDRPFPILLASAWRWTVFDDSSNPNDFSNRPNKTGQERRCGPDSRPEWRAASVVDRMRELTPQQRDRVLQNSKAFQKPCSRAAGPHPAAVQSVGPLEWATAGRFGARKKIRGAG